MVEEHDIILVAPFSRTDERPLSSGKRKVGFSRAGP
jgi:hypothetical protein